jgi:hypothetical protein
VCYSCGAAAEACACVGSTAEACACVGSTAEACSEFTPECFLSTAADVTLQTACRQHRPAPQKPYTPGTQQALFLGWLARLDAYDQSADLLTRPCCSCSGGTGASSASQQGTVSYVGMLSCRSCSVTGIGRQAVALPLLGRTPVAASCNSQRGCRVVGIWPGCAVRNAVGPDLVVTAAAVTWQHVGYRCVLGR